MKSSKVHSASSSAAGWQGGSSIPLPLRRSSTKSDKGPEVDQSDNESKDRYGNGERSGGKMSLLSGTSFCCASAQREDCAQDSKTRPQKKRPQKNVPKRDTEVSRSELGTPNAAALSTGAKKIPATKGRIAKTENDAAEERQVKELRQLVEIPSVKQRSVCLDDKRSSRTQPNNSHQDNRMLRPPDDRKRVPRPRTTGGDTVQQRKDTRPESEMDSGGKLKYTDVIRKLRKDPAQCTPNNLMALNVENNKLYEKGVKNTEENNACGENKGGVDDTVVESCEIETVEKENNLTRDLDDGNSTQENKNALVRSCGTEDFDCPCCDQDVDDVTINHDRAVDCSEEFCENSVKSNSPVSTTVVNSQNKSLNEVVTVEIESSQEKVRDLETEVCALQEELAKERLRLKNQESHVTQLEKEVAVMEQLKQELTKEQNLRKEAELKLLEVLEQLKNEAPAEQSTHLQLPELNQAKKEVTENICDVTGLENETSPILLGYESRIRRYQTYIAKLEKDNLMMLNEIKKFKDLSPSSQEEQAKDFLEKLGRLERHNQVQQREYESCLDEVANKLVHTLLIQKRLEEECKILHLRVEQLEKENEELLKLMNTTNENKAKNLDKVEKSYHETNFSSAQPICKSKSRQLVLHEVPPDSKSPIEKSTTSPETVIISSENSCINRIAEENEINSTEIKSNRGSLPSPFEKPNSASKIPAFNIAKPCPIRKKTKTESSNSITKTQDNTNLPGLNQTLIENIISSPNENASSRSSISSPANVASVPNVAKVLPFEQPCTKQKSSASSESAKPSSVKRKRLSKIGNQGEKASKEAKLRSKSQHIRWDQKIGSETKTNSKKVPTYSKTLRTSPSENLASLPSSTHVQEVWSFNCTLDNIVPQNLLDPNCISTALNSSKLKLGDAANQKTSIAEKGMSELEESIRKVFSPLRETECSSTSTESTHRTKDEGYSTMSSDLQPDSAADTTVSEHEDHSTTYIVCPTGLRCVSDDSVTECLDGSMSSSSDSGFGPLRQVTRTNLNRLLEDSTAEDDSCDSQKESDCSPSIETSSIVSEKTLHRTEINSIGGTSIMEIRPQTTEQKLMTIISEPPSSNKVCNIVYNDVCPTENHMFSISTDSPNAQIYKCKSIDSTPPLEHFNTVLSDGNETTNAQSQRFLCDSETQIKKKVAYTLHDVPCTNEMCQSPIYPINTNHSSISTCIPSRGAASITDCVNSSLFKQPNLWDKITNEEKIETAEKATLTEPEESMWREKALAHFIDESIWSLYSSESDTQLKHFPPEQFQNCSMHEDLDKNAFLVPQTDNSPGIVITKHASSQSIYEDVQQTDAQLPFEVSPVPLTRTTATAADMQHLGCDDLNRTRSSSHSLERVASDSVLYLKDAFHELEDSMKPGLKAPRNLISKNIPLLNYFSVSEVCVNVDGLGEPDENVHPEFLQSLEKTMFIQNNFAWPSSSVNPSRSSSLSSLQSSNSCYLVSDETEDVDIIQHTSRKGSQDPDLSSASDAEYENLEHKDFVERWIQKEITLRNDHKLQSPDAKERFGKWCSPSVKRKTVQSFLKYPEVRKIHPPVRGLPFPNPITYPNAVTLAAKEGLVKSKRSDASPTPNFDCFPANLAIPSPDEFNTSSSSSLLYPIIFTCENIDDDEFDPYVPGPNPSELEADLQLVEPELKKFNGDFYKLCNVGSMISLDHLFSGIPDTNENQELFLKQYLSSPKFSDRNHVRKKKETLHPKSPSKVLGTSDVTEIKSKPTGLVKPIRPVSLTFCPVPNTIEFHCFEKRDLSEKILRRDLNCFEEINLSPYNSILNLKKNNETIAENIYKTNDYSPAGKLNPPHFSKDLGEIHDSNPKYSLKASCAPHTSKTCGLGEVNTDLRCSYKSKNSLPYHKKYVLTNGDAVVHSGVVLSPKRNQSNQRSKSISSDDSPEVPPYSVERLQPLSPSRRFSSSDIKETNGIRSPRKTKGFSVLLGSPTRSDGIAKRQQLRRDRCTSRQTRIKEGRGTAWVHLQPDPNLADPKARASLLDSMVATTSSSGSSSSSTEEDDEKLIIRTNSHLQRICRERRHKVKASGRDEFFALPRLRSSIVNRHGLYYRYGDQEKEAMACFDFLEEIPISTSEPGSLEAFNRRPLDLDTTKHRFHHVSGKDRLNLLSPCASENNTPSCTSQFSSFNARFRLPGLWNKPLSHNMSSSTLNSQDCELLDHISLSDSCAESYSSTPDSFEEAS